MSDLITADMIEKVARAEWAERYPDEPWDEAHPVLQRWWRADAQRRLAAVAPLIAANALEQAANELLVQRANHIAATGHTNMARHFRHGVTVSIDLLRDRAEKLRAEA